MNPHAYRASVIIPARNAAAVIRDCLTALQHQDIDKSTFEIIVVDDGSTDDTVSIARSFPVQMIEQQNRGAAAARNAGVRLAQGEILLFTDSDCIPDPSWVREMLAPFEDSLVSGVKGAYRSEQRELTARFVQAEYEWKYQRMKRFKSIDFIDTYSAGFRASVFNETGGFDESFPNASVEDQEFSFRLHALGFKMCFIPNAIVTHHHADRWRHYLKKKYRIGYWKIRVLKLHPGKAFRDSHTPQLLKIQVLLSMFVGFGIPLSGFMSPEAILIPILAWIALSTPEVIACARSDGLILATSAPVFTFLRSIGLAAGLLHGLVNEKQSR